MTLQKTPFSRDHLFRFFAPKTAEMLELFDSNCHLSPFLLPNIVVSYRLSAGMFRGSCYNLSLGRKSLG